MEKDITAMEHITISRVGPSDLTTLQAISERTFFDTFASYNTEADMQLYLEQNLSMEKLAAEFSHPGTAFYFAMLGEAVIGYLKLNRGDAQTEQQGDDALEIERIYVLHAYHGQQVGQQLYEAALTIAREHGASFVWLGVWEHNARALRFYEKNGFKPFDKHIFKLGEDVQTDILLKISL